MIRGRPESEPSGGSMSRQLVSGVVLFFFVGLLTAGTGQFIEAPQFQVGTNPQAVAVGDFNADGKPDLAVINSTSDTLSILLGNGDGTFRTKSDYVTGITPQGVVVADFNGDGAKDVAVSNSASNKVSIFLGNGDGTFQAKVDYATGNKPIGMAAGDFNGDGHPDLVVTDAMDGSVGVLLNNGNGTFKAFVPYNTGFNPSSVVVRDFNGDGKLDIATTNNNNNSGDMVSILLGKGDGTFSFQLQYGTGKHPVSIAAGDVNGDGKLDLVVAEQSGNTVSVLLGNGDGSFSANVDYNTAPFPTGVTLGDFDGDGYLDIAVTAGNGNTVSVLLGNGDGTYKPQLSWGVGDIPYAIVVADLNGDNKLDLVVANSGSNNVSAVIGNGDGTFQTRLDYAVGPNPNWVATGDFNGDGNIDLAVVTSNCPSYPSCGPGSVSIVLGNGDGSFQAPSHFSTGTDTDPYAVAVADLNGDGKLDLAVTNYITGTIGIMLGVGDGTFPTHSDYPVGSEPTSVAIADLNGDGNPDVVVPNFHSNTLSVLFGNGDGSFKSAVSYATGNGPISVAAADFNGDHKLDLVVVNESENDVGILLGNGNGTFKAQVTYSTGAGGNPLSVQVGDFNGDNNLDLAVADFHTQQVSILIGNGDGTFQPVKAYATGANPSSVVMADFNGDGKLDLALTSTPLASSAGNLLSLLPGNGDGTFRAPTVFGTGSEAYSAAVGDFNSDGAPDLAIANGISDTVSILLNTEGTRMNVVSSGSPSIHGDSVTFTTTVQPSAAGSGFPTGTVTVRDGNTLLGSGELIAGEYSVSTSILSTGAHSISSSYSGDSTFLSHTVTITQTVEAAGTKTVLASSSNPIGVGKSVSFSATVNSTTSGTPTGMVTFTDGTVSLGTATLNSSGIATLSSPALSMGTHQVFASYSGDANFNSSTSATLNQIVGKATTTVTLTDTADLTLSATVVSETGAFPAGTVSFMDGSSQLGSATLNASGVATLTTTSLTAGSHSIIASYGGADDFDPSTSPVLNVSADFSLSASAMSPGSVTPGQPSTSTISISPINGFNSSLVSLSCSVTATASPAPTCAVGSVSLQNDNGTATLTVNTNASSAHASFMGSSATGLFAVTLLLSMVLFGGVSLQRDGRKNLISCAAFTLVFAGCLLQAACGGNTSGNRGSGQTGTPSGKYTVTVTGKTQTGVQHSATTTFTVQ